MWKTFKNYFAEAYLNFETARGIYLLPAGVVIIYVSIFHTAFVIQTAGSVLGLYISLDGLRKILVNRVKQEVKFQQQVEKRAPADVA